MVARPGRRFFSRFALRTSPKAATTAAESAKALVEADATAVNATAEMEVKLKTGEDNGHVKVRPSLPPTDLFQRSLASTRLLRPSPSPTALAHRPRLLSALTRAECVYACAAMRACLHVMCASYARNRIRSFL